MRKLSEKSFVVTDGDHEGDHYWEVDFDQMTVTPWRGQDGEWDPDETVRLCRAEAGSWMWLQDAEHRRAEVGDLRFEIKRQQAADTSSFPAWLLARHEENLAYLQRTLHEAEGVGPRWRTFARPICEGIEDAWSQWSAK